MTGHAWLRAILAARPTTWPPLMAFVGDLGVDVGGRDWFGFFRDRLPPPLSAVSVSFDPFRDVDASPLAFYRVSTRIPIAEATAIAAHCGLPPGFALESSGGRLMLDWRCPAPVEMDAALEVEVREQFLQGLLARLASASSGPTLRFAVTAPPAAAISVKAQPAQVREGDVLVPARAPIVELELVPAMEAQQVAVLLRVQRPVAISTDVHQVSWWMVSRGRTLDEPQGRRADASELQVGPWDVRLALEDRPRGGLPGLWVGPSPAYDLAVTPARVRAIEIRPRMRL